MSEIDRINARHYRAVCAADDEREASFQRLRDQWAAMDAAEFPNPHEDDEQPVPRWLAVLPAAVVVVLMAIKALVGAP